jgi:putative transposase
MPRRPRVAPGGVIYHVLNRSVGRMRMFTRPKDFEAFMRVLAEAHERFPIRILSFCVMPSHWHFVVWPRDDKQLTSFFRWLAHTHAMRWRTSRNTVGYGHLYQGRFKSFPIQSDGHLLTACRYVERNALAGGLVKRSRDWQWSSLWVRTNGTEPQKAMLSPWPMARPDDWAARIDEALTQKELERIKLSIERSQPLGNDTWVSRMAVRLHLEHTLRREGRPSKDATTDKRSTAD